MKNYFVITFTIILFLFSPLYIFGAQLSSYELPYPSAMPGSIFYKLNLVKEILMKYWYFGNLGQFAYNQQMSDKYLVEANVLCEYKQYFLCLEALKKSDNYFFAIEPTLASIKKAGEPVDTNSQSFQQEEVKHIEILKKLRRDIPQTALWAEPGFGATPLKLWDVIDNSISIRILHS